MAQWSSLKSHNASVYIAVRALPVATAISITLVCTSLRVKPSFLCDRSRSPDRWNYCQQSSAIIRKHFSAIEQSLAIVSDYVETLFSDRAIVGDRERSYASVIPATGDRKRSYKN